MFLLNIFAEYFCWLFCWFIQKNKTLISPTPFYIIGKYRGIYTLLKHCGVKRFYFLKLLILILSELLFPKSITFSGKKEIIPDLFPQFVSQRPAPMTLRPCSMRKSAVIPSTFAHCQSWGHKIAGNWSRGQQLIIPQLFPADVKMHMNTYVQNIEGIKADFHGHRTGPLD